MRSGSLEIEEKKKQKNSIHSSHRLREKPQPICI